MRLHRSVCLALIVAPLPPAAAQTSGGDAAAVIALRATHIGALTPMMTPAMLGRHLNGAQLGVRYGLRDELGVFTQGVALSGIFGVGLQSSVALTAGITDGDCSACSPAMLLGVGGDMRIYESGDVVSNSSLSIVVSGDIGYAQIEPGEGSGVALGIGAPVTLSLGAATNEGGMRFTPFFTPVFGIGQLNDACPVGFTNCERNGVRWVLGGGIGVWNPMSSVSASIGINQVVVSGARPVFGVNVSLGGR